MNIVPYKLALTDTICIESKGRKVTSNDPYVLLDFLLQREESELSVVWNVDEFIAIILRTFPEEELRKLSKTKKCKLLPYHIFYIKEKMFNIKKSRVKQTHSFYSLDQYFRDLEDQPEDMQSLCDQLGEALEIMNLQNTTKLTSPIAIYKDVMFKHQYIPSYENVAPEKVLTAKGGLYEYCIRCANKPWIEAFKIGYFPKTYDYDMVSCYPGIAMNLLDTKQIDWRKTNRYEKKAAFGYCKGQITIPDRVRIHPFMYVVTGNGREIPHTPVGTWQAFITKEQWDFMNKWNLGEFELEDAWWGFYTAPAPLYPLRNILSNLLNFKSHSNKLVAMLGKLMANGFYGSFGELREDEDGMRYGPYANCVYFCEIQSRARLHVADWIYRNKAVDNVIHISVDGVLTDREI